MAKETIALVLVASALVVSRVDAGSLAVEKNSPRAAQVDTSAPEPTSTDGPSTQWKPTLSETNDASGTAIGGAAAAGSKNDASGALAWEHRASRAGDLRSSCGAVGNLDWITISGSFLVIRQCEVSVPAAGWLFLSANGSLGNHGDGEYEAAFRVGVDSTAGDPNVGRWVNVYDDQRDGTDGSVALTLRSAVTAGVHTAYFLGARYAGAGTVLVRDPTLSAVFVPADNATFTSCSASGANYWSTTSSNFQVVRQCSLTLPRAASLFIAADASVYHSDGAYEANLRIGIDSTSGDAGVDRWVDVEPDSGDGTDGSVALTVRKNVAAGAHTIYLLARRAAGTATVNLLDSTLTAIATPNSGTCAASGNQSVEIDAEEFAILRQCTVSVPNDGPLFVSADASLFDLDGPYEANFRIGIDGTAGDEEIDRWVDVDDNSGDGTDRTVALSAIRDVSAGNHTVYLLARRWDGHSSVGVFDSTLSVTADVVSIFADDFELGLPGGWSSVTP